MKNLKSVLSMLLALALCLSFCACSNQTNNNNAAETPDAAGQTFENGGTKLQIPAEYLELVELRTDDPDGTGELFSVSEKASLEAARKMHPDNVDGIGWLFSVRKTDEAGYINTITSDMSGVDVIGKDAAGNYYLLCTPTDVRFEREDMSNYNTGSEDFQQWSKLCEWAASVKTSFCEDNGLTPITLTNTEVDIYLNRLAYLGVDDALFRTLDYGDQPLNKIDSSEYLQKLLDGLTIERLEYAEDENSLTQAPDGEYYCLTLPTDDVRIDFFKADGTMVRVVNGWGGAQLFRANKDCTAIVAQWLEALSAAE